MANIVKAFFKWFSVTLAIMLGIVCIMLLLLQLPKVKRYLTFQTLNVLGGMTNHNFDLEEVSIDWLDQVSLRGFVIHDFQDSVMLSVDHLSVNYSLFDLISRNKIQVDWIAFADGEFNLLKHDDSTSVNINVFLASLSREANVEKEKPILSVGGVELENFGVNYHDLRKLEAEGLSPRIFDPSWFDFDVDKMSASEILLKNDSLSMLISTFTGIEQQSNLPVHSFQADFGLYPHAIVMNNLDIKAGKSHIQDSISLAFSKPAMLGYFRDSVTIAAYLKDATLSLTDLKYFSKVNTRSELLSVSGQIVGKLSNLDLKNMFIKSRSGSFMRGNASLIGLPNVGETFMDIRVSSSRLENEELSHYVSLKNLNPGDVDFKGDLLGFVNDFVATGTFITKDGEAYSDLNLKLEESSSNANYSGRLVLKEFDLGSFIQNKRLGKVNFDGSLSGRGLSMQSADLKLKAVARQLEFGGYTFDSIAVNGRIRSNFFEGVLSILDPKIELGGRAKIDFASPEEEIDMDLIVQNLDLQGFDLAVRPTRLFTRIKADLSEININETSGTVSLENAVLKNDLEQLAIKKITLEASVADQKRYILNSDLAKIQVDGDFQLLDVARDLPRLLEAYKRYFVVSQSEVKQFYKSNSSYSLEMEMDLYDVDPIISMLGQKLSISDSTKVEATFSQKNDVSLFLYSSIDTIQMGERIFYGNSIELNASKDTDSTEVLALIQVHSDLQKWNDRIETKWVDIESIWDNHSIKSVFNIEQPQNQNKANFIFDTWLREDTIDFKVLPSKLQIFNTDWNISKENSIRILKDKVIINELEMYNRNQSVAVDGIMSDSFLTQIKFDFVNFDILNISTVLPRSIEGLVNASGRISRLNNSRPMRIESDIDIEELKFEGLLVGNLKGISEWDRDENGLFVDYSIERENINTIDLEGYVRPFEDNQLELTAAFDQANLNLLEPIFSYMVSDLSGNATGQVSLTGQFSGPIVRGLAAISDGKVTIDYLNTTYRFSGVSRFFENQIAFDNINVLDRLNNEALLNGAIRHNQFKDFVLNVDLSFENFELLNTTQQQNSLYYGNAYGTGTMRMIGPSKDLKIKAEATSSSDTRIYIPLIEESGIEQGEFISFTQKGNIDLQEDEEVSISGITIDFDMNITPDAYIELIFNPRTGDIIRGRGDGNLQLTVNSSGDFDLFGNYTVSEGAYNFTYSLINKEFQVQPGGTITWFGDPYEGQMDMTATYRQLADINDWQGPTGTDQPTTSQKQPVLVLLDMEGPMLAPDINFKLQLENEGNLSSTDIWSKSLATINANDEELKRQVFSLMILRKFSEHEGFVVGSTVGQGFTSSMGEFLGNQLSYWVNQVDENLEIDFDINDLSSEAFNTFQLRLAYSFFDGRLRVTRGGGFTTIVDESATSDLNSILGDWSVEYILTEDGQWRARFFSRNNQAGSNNQSVSLSQGQETGFSFQFVRSFDEFREIMSAGRKKDDRAKSVNGDSSE